MNKTLSGQRRDFLSTAVALTAGGFLSTNDSVIHAAEVGRTEHFLYRLAPQWPYIDSQRGHKAFAFDHTRVLLSEDNGNTWAYRAAFEDAENTGIIYSPDLGSTWAQYDLKEFGERSGVRVNPRNSDGWFRMCLRQKWMHNAEVLFIKPVS